MGGFFGIFGNLTNLLPIFILYTIMKHLLYILFFAFGFACAQEKTITGKVTNYRNMPMYNVTVVSFPSKITARTDTYGNYMICSASGETLRLNVDESYEEFLVNDKKYRKFTVSNDTIINIQWPYARWSYSSDDLDEPRIVEINTYKVTQHDLDSTYCSIVNDSIVRRAAAQNFENTTIFFGKNYSSSRFTCLFQCKEISGRVKKEILVQLIKEHLAVTKEFPLGVMMRGNDRLRMGENRIGNIRTKYITDKPAAINKAVTKQMGVHFASCLYYINGREYVIKDKTDAEKVLRKISRMRSISAGTMPASDNYYGVKGIMGVVFVTRSKD